MTTMIALVGEQPLPNFLPVRQYERITHVLLVYTHTTEQHFKYLQEKLQMEVETVYGLKTDPYDMRIIVDKLNAKLDELEARKKIPFEFNLTGGTKPMALAAYQVAARRQAPIIYVRSEKNAPITIDHYIWKDDQLTSQESKPLTTYIELEDALELYLGPRETIKGEATWSIVEPTQDINTFGHLFELAIAKALKEGGYKVICCLKGHGNQLDIDVMIGYHNQIGIIEAKTSGGGGVKKPEEIVEAKEHSGDKSKKIDGQVTKLDGIKQLSYAMQYLKGTYIKQFHVIAGTSSDNLTMMCKTLDIPLISLPNYKRGPTATTLPDEDRKVLLAEIDRVMKVD